MAVYVANIVINTDTDFSQTFTFDDASSNAPLNLTGYSISATLRKWPGAADTLNGVSQKTTFTTTILSASGGRIQISLTDNKTGDLNDGRHVYDILLTDPSGNKTRVIEGSALVRKGVSR